MPAVVVVGAQWGDEGKGKLIDLFSSQVDFVVRYQGGANAGHTLKVGKEECVVHLVPSSVFHPHVKSVIGSGVVLDLELLCEEIKTLKQTGRFNEAGFFISDSATLLLDSHKMLDQAREASKGSVSLGTTGRGIGPAYESRSSRKALLFADLFEEESVLLSKLNESLGETHFLLSHLYGQKPSSHQQILKKLLKSRELLRAYRCSDPSLLLQKNLEQGKKVLFEGAQGALLDLFYGTYPYVTSSSTLTGSALVSSGLGFKHFTKTLAIAKAYTTRVGSGPFPTECSEEASGLFLQKKGGEFGATTGRKRRCGWLDLPALKYANRLNGASHLILTKLDVLSGLKEIKLCTAYKIRGRTFDYIPSFLKDFTEVQPIYKIFKSWTKDLSSIRSKDELPQEARDYIDFIRSELDIEIMALSLGPCRSQVLYFDSLFSDS